MVVKRERIGNQILVHAQQIMASLLHARPWPSLAIQGCKPHFLHAKLVTLCRISILFG